MLPFCPFHVRAYDVIWGCTRNQSNGKTPMQTFIDSLHLAKEKMLDKQYDKMNNDNHLSAVGHQKASDEISARPEDTSENNQNSSSVHFSLAGIKEDVNFAEAVNGE